MFEVEEVSVRRVMTQATGIVNQELDRLHSELRDRDGLIDSQQKQIKIMRQSVELADDRKNRAYGVADVSVIVMYIAIAITFIAIGYAVWVG